MNYLLIEETAWRNLIGRARMMANKVKELEKRLIPQSGQQ